MVDALVSGASVARRVGSSPILGTRFLRRTTKVARLFFVLCGQWDSHSLWRLGRLVGGYIEFAGEIVKISSAEDIERVLERIKATDKA